MSGEITYTPSANFFGTDSLTYTVADNEALTSNAGTVTLTVTNVNDVPVAGDDSAVTGEDTPVLIDVIANDNDIDSAIDSSTVTIVTQPIKGSVVVHGTTGVITYTPVANFFGTDSFVYTVDDDQGATSNLATVTLTVTCNRRLQINIRRYPGRYRCSVQ